VLEQRVDGDVGSARVVVAPAGAGSAARRPLLTATIGLTAATRLATVPNRRGLPKDSR
jgi:hypothetical protein